MIGTTHEYAVIEPDDSLPAAKTLIAACPADIVASRFQFPEHVFRHATLYRYRTTTQNAKTGRFDGFLNVHAEIHHVREHLHVPLRLHVASHDAETHPGLLIFHHETGNDGVQGPLLGRDTVRVAFFQHEAAAPVLEHDARLAPVMPEPK